MCLENTAKMTVGIRFSLRAASYLREALHRQSLCTSQTLQGSSLGGSTCGKATKKKKKKTSEEKRQLVDGPLLALAIDEILEFLSLKSKQPSCSSADSLAESMNGLTILAEGLMSLLWGAACGLLDLGLAEGKARLCLLTSVAIDSVGSIGPSIFWDLTVMSWVRCPVHIAVVVVVGVS